MWAKETVNYEVEYPRDFQINDVTESLSQAQQALDLGFRSDTFSAEVSKKVLEAYMPNIEPDTYDDIVSEIEEGFDEAERDRDLMKQQFEPMNDKGDVNAEGQNAEQPGE